MCSLFLILEDVPIEKKGRLEPQDVKGSGSLYSQEGSQGGTRVREIHSKLLTDHEPSVSKLLETHYLMSLCMSQHLAQLIDTLHNDGRASPSFPPPLSPQLCEQLVASRAMPQPL